MEGIYVRFKETDHSIWIGTHKYGMVIKDWETQQKSDKENNKSISESQ